MMHLETFISTSTPNKTFNKIMECFRRGKDPQGLPVEGWKVYLDDENPSDFEKAIYGRFLVYAKEGEEKRTYLILTPVGEDEEEKKDTESKDGDKEELEPAYLRGKYIKATTGFWREYEQNNPHELIERERLLTRFDALMLERFARLFDVIHRQ